MARPGSSYGGGFAEDLSGRAHGQSQQHHHQQQQQPPPPLSSQQQQHVINMGTVDPGVQRAASGGPGQQGVPMAHAGAPTLPPGAYNSSPSKARSPTMQHKQRQNNAYSPLPPGPSATAGGQLPSMGFDGTSYSHLPAYVSPRLSQLSPHSASSPSSTQTTLGRSQSLGHAAYQQLQNSVYNPMSPTQPHPIDSSSPYRSRDRREVSVSDGGSTSSYAPQPPRGGPSSSGGSLLPTINTHIPSGNFMNSPYSPQRASMIVDTPSYSGQHAGGRGSRSPTGLQTGTSSYAPHSSNRPVSMFADPSSSSSYAPSTSNNPGASRSAYMDHPTSLSPSHRLSPSRQYAGSRPPVESGNGSQLMGDSLPLYTSNTGAPTGRLSSPYQQGQISVGGAPMGYGSHNDADRMSVEPGEQQRRERRTTLTPSGVESGAGYDWSSQPHPAKVRPAIRPAEGFRRVRDLSDLKTNTDLAQQGKGRRADPTGGYVSPLKAMTAYLHHTYHLVNPSFFYELSFNPRRVLTKPSKPMHNDGHDNEDSDYILYVNDWLGAEEGNRYLILDILGQGTFGQVVKCQNMKTHEIVAVKVIKNKPAYFNQSMMEVTILEMLNGSWDPNDEHHILRLRDTFIHAKHLCLVFELLSSNLYELIKQNSFRGLSTSLVKVFTTQLLDALTVLNEARLIHCDLKPENILLKTLQTPSIKLVDFGSACHERQTVYTYIQSRFYRSPEVLLGLPYNSAIDMWSLGCIAVELFLGLPLFPGTSEYNQVCRIVEMLGLPPAFMLENGKQTGEFFSVYTDDYGRRNYRLKSLEQYSREHNVQEQPSKRYFEATTLPDIIKTYPLARKSGKSTDVQKEMANRTSFVDFVSGLLHMDPSQRWTPQQAKLHPFITGEKFTQPFKPPPTSPTAGISSSRSSKALTNEDTTTKHPYGGLPQTAPRSSGRAYHDAAAYNQHLAQQQTYNSVHQARQAQLPAVNNPYAREEAAAAQAQAQQAEAQAQAQAVAKAQAQVQAQHAAQAHAHAAQMHATMSPPHYGDGGGRGPNAASGGAYAQTQNRSRSNTLTRMDIIPPKMARMGLDSNTGAGQSVTPVLNREESLREWERRQQNGAQPQQQQQQQRPPIQQGQAGGKTSSTSYQNLEMLQQQAEMSPPAAGGWGQPQWSATATSPSYQASSNRHSSYHASPKSGGSVTSPSMFSVVVDSHDNRRLVNPHDASMASSASLRQLSTQSPTSHIAAPPAAYSGPSSSSAAGAQAARYQPTQQQPSSATTASGLYGNAGLSFDPYDTGIAQLMPALKPTQYQHHQQPHQSGGPSSSSNRHSMAVMMSPTSAGAPLSAASPQQGSAGGIGPSTMYAGLVPGSILPPNTALSPSSHAAALAGGSGGADAFAGLDHRRYSSNNNRLPSPGHQQQQGAYHSQGISSSSTASASARQSQQVSSPHNQPRF